MPLHSFADEIIRLSQRHASTPVMVTDRRVSLRDEFFAELVAALTEKTNRSIRFDWCQRMSGPLDFLCNRLARSRSVRLNRRLAALMIDRDQTARIELTASIGRPGGIERDLIIGLCNNVIELPPWTTAIHLGGSPEKPGS